MQSGNSENGVEEENGRLEQGLAGAGTEEGKFGKWKPVNAGSNFSSQNSTLSA